jgi:hypothetical protein
VDNLQRFRLFYIAYASIGIYATASRKSPAQPTGKYATLQRISGGEHIFQTPSAISPLTQIAARFPLPDEKLIAADLQKTQRMLERRGTAGRGTAMKSQR